MLGIRLTILIVPLTALSGCMLTPNGYLQFQTLSQSGSYSAPDTTLQVTLPVNTKVDLLWIVANSSSMEVEQQKLRDGVAAFTQTYLQPTWDIRIAVIPTDTYLAGSQFHFFETNLEAGSVDYVSPYINSVFNGSHPFNNPTTDPTLLTYTGSSYAFVSGFDLGQVIPAWATSYSRLIPGNHDGPMAALCVEYFPYFLWGSALCSVRDVPGAPTGVAACLNPSGSETGASQCVNTLENNTVHSGTTVISTQPPADTAGNQTWVNSLISTLTINISTGTTGDGSERGMESILQLIQDNESSTTAFFRPGSTRALVFVTAKDDQSMITEPNPTSSYTPYTHYLCDQSALVQDNPTLTGLTASSGTCCSGGTCEFGAEGTSCSVATKTIDGFTYTPGICPNPDQLLSVSSVKAQLDSFFLGLDGNSATQANYMIASVVALGSTSIQAIQNERNEETADVAAASPSQGLNLWTVDEGDRYIQLGQMVGNGSVALDLGSSDYSSVFDSIGAAIVQQKGSFPLSRAPFSQERVVVSILHADGSFTSLSPTQFTMNGSTLVISDQDAILSFQSTDQVQISFQQMAPG
jgi:hypothetical protein